MDRSMKMFKALALSAFTLGLMAVIASSAQAKPEWMVNGTNVTNSTLLPKLEVKEVEQGTASLLSTVGTVKTEILCTEADLKEFSLDKEGKLTHGKVVFLHCKMFLNGILSSPCEPYTELTGSVIDHGTIETNKFKGIIELHEPSAGVHVAVINLQPLNGGDEPFVNLLLGEECAIGENLPILGKLVLEDCNGKAETEEVEHLVQENKALTKLFVIDLNAAHAATLDGSAWLRLGGTHAGLKWSALAA